MLGYFLASQLLPLKRWLESLPEDPVTLLEAQVVGSLEGLRNLINRDKLPMVHCTSMMRNVVRAWKQVHLGCPTSAAALSPFTPLWFNMNLGQLLTIPDPALWARFNVKYVNDIYADNVLLTFDQLKDKFNLPNRMFFRFLQLQFMQPGVARLSLIPPGRCGFYTMTPIPIDIETHLPHILIGFHRIFDNLHACPVYLG
ncbi:hypothetical protein XELAEV_18005116mg [Xenopus laevis]|uniref:Uncharacterized protein n=1 Tax=Xenopus laevis TaxID=8355 RepID=A0A974DWA1_XENLA|nr:hypothetical protein XELAEV_18005116mg [Xenopus laevis]